jgi:hypothetical protein
VIDLLVSLCLARHALVQLHNPAFDSLFGCLDSKQGLIAGWVGWGGKDFAQQELLTHNFVSKSVEV